MSTQIRWPNFFIVGVPKAGTTSLYEYLKKSQQIYMSAVKEPHYFPTAPTETQPRFSKEKYLSFFKKVKNQKIIGEASPGYIYSLYAPKLIHEVSSDARILISLRDPVERIYSAYLMLKNTRDTDLPPFKEWIDELLQYEKKTKQRSKELFLGLYSDPIQRYWQTFGKKQVKILIFEEFINETKKTIDEIFQFLGLRQETFDFKIEKHKSFSIPRGFIGKKIVSSKKIKKIGKKIVPPSTQTFILNKFLTNKFPKPKMDESVKQSLINYYHKDVLKTEKLLERKLPWDNFFH